MSVQGYLRILKRSGEGGSLFPVKGSCRIGRSSQCDVRIMLPDVAPVHCIITGDEHGQGLVQNMSLTKPTLVNGVPMAKNLVDLAHYDLITLADRTLRWEYLPNSPFYVMRAEGVHMSHLGSKDISGRMVTVPLSALQKSPTAHLTTPKNARGRKSVGTPSRNPITPLSSRKSNISPSRNPITPLSSRKSNALIAVVSPTRRNKEIQSPPSMEPELSEIKPQPKKRVSLPVKKTVTPLKSNSRRTLHGMPTAPTKPSPRRLHVIKSDTPPLDHPTTGDVKSKKLKDIKIISKPTSTPLRKSTGVRRSVPGKPLTPRPVSRKSMPALIVGLARNAIDKRSSTSSPSDRNSKSWKISDLHRSSISSAATSPSDRKSKSWRTSDAHSTISSATKAPKIRRSTPSVKSPETSPRQKAPRRSSGVFSPKKSLKSTLAKDLKRTPGSSKVIAQKEFKTLIPRLVVSSTKRKFEDDLVSAERAAKRMKMVKSPKSPDKKKMAAILQCHGKSPHNAAKIRKPLFSEVLKTSIAGKKVPKHQNLGRSRPAPNKRKPITTSLKLTTVVPKSFRFNSTGHADSPETIIIRKGKQVPVTNIFKSPLSAARKSSLTPKANSRSIGSDPSVSLPSTSGLRSSFTTTPILKKKSLASFDISTCGTPSRKSVHFSTTNLTLEETKSPRKGRLSLVEKSLSFDYDTQDKEVPSRNTRPSISTPLKLIEERKQFQDSENELAPKQTSRKSSTRRSLASPEERRGFLPESSNSETPEIDMTGREITKRSSGRKSIAGTPSSAQKLTHEKRSGVVEGDRSAKKSLTRRLSPSEKRTSSDSESCDERIHRKSGVRKSLGSSAETRQDLSAAKNIASSDSETPTRKVSRKSGVRKSLISPGEPLSAPSPIGITPSDSENPDKITSRRSGARKSIVTPVKSLNARPPVEIPTSGSENPDKSTSRRSGARKSIVTPVKSLNVLSPVEITTSDSENPNNVTSRRSGARKGIATPVESLSTLSPVEITTSDSETSNKMSRRSGAAKGIVTPVHPVHVQSPVEITLDSETPNKMSRRSGARKSLVAPVEPKSALSPVEIISHSESPNKKSRRSGARKSLIAPVETLSAPSPVEITTPDSETLGKITSRRSGGRNSLIAPVEPLCTPSPIEKITLDSDTPNKVSRRSSAKKSFVVPVEPLSALTPVEKITSYSETPNKMSRRSGARKSIIAPVEPSSALSPVEITLDSETPDKMSRRSGAKKSFVVPVEPLNALTPVEKITSYSETPNKMSRRSGARESIVAPVVPSSALSPVEITSDSDTPGKMSRRSGARKSIVTPVQPLSALSPVEITSDSETPNKMSRRSGAGKSIVTPVEPVNTPSPVEKMMTYSETPNKIASRRSGARKSFVPNDSLSDSETLKKVTFRRSDARNSLVIPVEQRHSISTDSDSQTSEKMQSRRSGAKKDHVRLSTSDSESPEAIQYQHSGARRSFVARVDRSVEKMTAPKEKLTRRSFVNKSIIAPVESHSASDTESQVEVPSRSSSRKSTKYSPVQERGDLTDSAPSSGKHSKSGKSFRSSIQLKFGELNTQSSPKSSSKRLSRRSSLLFKKDKISTPIKYASKSISPLMRSGKLQQENDFISLSSSVRCEASTSSVLGISLTESELSLLVSPKSSTSSLRSGSKRSIDLLLDEEEFPSRKRRSTSVNSISAVLDGSDATSFDFSAFKTPSIEQEYYVSPLSATSNAGLRTSPRKKLASGQRRSKASLRRSSSKGGLPHVHGVKRLLKTPRTQPSPRNDLTHVQGTRRLFKTPRLQQSPKNDLTDVRGVGKLLRTPRPQRSPKNDLSDVRGVKKLLGSPRLQRSPKNDLRDVRGVKKLLGSPRLQRSPKNDLRDVRGVKKLLGSPRVQRSPKNDLRDVRGVKKLLSSPRLQRSPKNDLRDIRGVKKLLGSPRLQRSPKNDLSDVRGVKKLLGSPRLQRSPKNDLSDVRGVKKLLGSPRLQRSPKNELTDVRGIKKLLGSPRRQRSPKNDLSDVRGIKKLLVSPRLQRSPKNDLTRIEGVQELFENSSISRTSRNTFSNSLDVNDLQLFNSSPKSPSAQFENSSELSGARRRARGAAIGQSKLTARRPDVETRTDSGIVEEGESSVKAASVTKTKKGHGKTSSNTKSQSPVALIGATETEEMTVSKETRVAPAVKTRRGKATASVIQLATPETFSHKGGGLLDVEDSSGASILRTRRAAGGKHEVQTEKTSPRKTRGKAAAKETNTIKLIADQEDRNSSGKKSKTRSNKIVFNSPVKQGEVNAETTNLENQVTEITSALKKRGRTVSKPDNQSTLESLPKTRLGRAAAKRVDAETSKLSTLKSPVQKSQKEICAELESNTAEEFSLEKPLTKRRGGPATKREVRVAGRTVLKSQEGKMQGRMTGKFESLTAGVPVPDALDNMNKEIAAANDVQISGKSTLRSPVKKGKKGIATKLESHVTEELVAHTPDGRKRGRIGANQDAEKVVPGTPDKKRRGRAAAQTDKFQETSKSVSKSPEQRKHGNTLVNGESESTSDLTSDTSKRRGRAAATKQKPQATSREPSKSPEQKRTRRGEAKFEVQPTEAPTSVQKRRNRGAKPESETAKESSLNSSNQTRRGRRATVAPGLESQSTDESTTEISLQQERRLGAKMELPRPKRRGRVAAEVESQPAEVPSSSDRTRPGRTAAKSESQTSANQKKQKDEVSLESQPIVRSPNRKKRGRTAAEHEAHSVDTLPSPPKRTKRGRVAAEVDNMPLDKSLGGLDGGQTVPPKVSKQNKSNSTEKGTRTSSDSQSPERVLRAASNRKTRHGRTVAEVVETHLVPTTKTKVKSQTPSPRKTRSRK